MQLMATQMAALQRGFTTLADAVLDELDTVRAEAAQYKRERDDWALAMQQMKREQAELRALFSLTDVRLPLPPFRLLTAFACVSPSMMPSQAPGASPAQASKLCSMRSAFAGSQCWFNTGAATCTERIGRPLFAPNTPKFEQWLLSHHRSPQETRPSRE